MAKRALPLKQALFVAALPKVNWVGTDAVIKAGYKAKNRQIAGEIACELLKKTEIRQAVDKMMNERLQNAGIYVERVLLELGKIGFSDIRNAFDDNGTLKLPKDWPEDLRGVISGVESFEEFSGRGESRELIGYTKKIRTYDKIKALELLGKHLKIFPFEKKSTEETPQELNLPTNLELSAKIFYLIQIAIQKNKEKKTDKSIMEP